MKTDIIPYQKMTAEAILYKENDPLLRYAIYKAYKYRCAYTGKFLYDYIIGKTKCERYKKRNAIIRV